VLFRAADCCYEDFWLYDGAPIVLAFALTSGDRVLIGVVVVVAAWLMLAMMTATCGANRGFDFGPLFVCSLFLGFPLVLLAVTIGAPILAHARRDTDEEMVEDG